MAKNSADCSSSGSCTDDVLILTEEFIGPDLRELRSFVNGYLRRDFQAFRDSIERMREIALDLLQTRPHLPRVAAAVRRDVRSGHPDGAAARHALSELPLRAERDSDRP